MNSVPKGTVDDPIIGDIWTYHQRGNYIVIPVNLQGIHGRGLAKQAKDKGLITQGSARCVNESPVHRRIYTVAVKGAEPGTRKLVGAAYSERVTRRNVELLDRELAEAMKRFWAISNGEFLVIPFLGLGFGEGDPKEILPVLRKYEDVYTLFISPSEEVAKTYAASLRPGVRKDKFAA